MKNSIAREYLAVEPQESSRPPHAPRRAPSRTTAHSDKSVLPQPARQPVGPSSSGPILFVGLDVHNDSIAVSLAPSDSTEVRRYLPAGRQAASSAAPTTTCSNSSKNSKPLILASN